MNHATGPHIRARAVAVLAASAMVTSLLASAGASAWEVAPGDTAASAGVASIGIAEWGSDFVVPGNQGVKPLKRAASGQAIGDIRLVLPNGFSAGDQVDLTVDNPPNGPAAASVTFDARGTVTVAGPYRKELQVASNTSNADPGVVNAERVATLRHAGFTTVPGKSAAVAPKITATLRDSGNGHPNDTMRLTIAERYATNSDPEAKWMVTLRHMSVTVGNEVTGEIRVTATMRGTGTLPPFKGSDGTVRPTTIPGYIGPASLQMENGSVVADGTDQFIGRISLKDNVAGTLKDDGLYRVQMLSAGTGLSFVTSGIPSVTVVDQTTGKQAPVTATASFESSNTMRITLGSGLDPAKRYTVDIDGALATAQRPGSVSYSFDNLGPDFVPPTPYLGTGLPVNQTDLAYPKDNLWHDAFAIPTRPRLGGYDRYGTNYRVVDQNFPDGTEADDLILATGAEFPDALSAGYLAAVLDNKPLMLTPSRSLHDGVKDKLRNLGIKKVWIVGGTGAISQDVEDTLKALPAYRKVTHTVAGKTTISMEPVPKARLTVVRLAGADRFATNKAVNSAAEGIQGGVGRTFAAYGQAAKRTAVFANGMNFPDALAATPLVVGSWDYGPIPIILTNRALQADATSQIEGFGIQRAILIGGTGVISSAQETELAAMGISVKRLAGADRYQTAAAVNDFAEAADPYSSEGDEDGLSRARKTAVPYLVNGGAFPDALTAGVNGLGAGKILLLTTATSLHDSTRGWLTAQPYPYDYTVAVGGYAVVSESALATANRALRTK